jgi:hypothetical protein
MTRDKIITVVTMQSSDHRELQSAAGAPLSYKLLISSIAEVHARTQIEISSPAVTKSEAALPTPLGRNRSRKTNIDLVVADIAATASLLRAVVTG